jgi:hypothetical protein
MGEKALLQLSRVDNGEATVALTVKLVDERSGDNPACTIHPSGSNPARNTSAFDVTSGTGNI